MLRFVVASALMLTEVMAAPMPAQAAVAPAARPSANGRCQALKVDWTAIEKELASIAAADFSDDSAPRATMRAIQTNNQLTLAQMTLTMMQAAGCSLPSEPPSEQQYLTSALDCRTERLKGVEKPTSCDRATWKPLFE